MSAASQRVEDLPPASDKRHYYVAPVAASTYGLAPHETRHGCIHGAYLVKFGKATVCGRPPQDRTVHLPPPGRSADL